MFYHIFAFFCFLLFSCGTIENVFSCGTYRIYVLTVVVSFIYLQHHETETTKCSFVEKISSFVLTTLFDSLKESGVGGDQISKILKGGNPKRGGGTNFFTTAGGKKKGRETKIFRNLGGGN